MADARGHRGEDRLFGGRYAPGSISWTDGFPGIAPFVRGPYPHHVHQPAVDDPAVCRVLDGGGFQRLLSPQPGGGQKGLSVAFDLATHRGYDSDHPRVTGDVGMAGVAIDSIYDMRTLFAGIPLDQMSSR
jgi:methylmalonyl-CoA mutase